jgi:hypothetical protein
MQVAPTGPLGESSAFRTEVDLRRSHRTPLRIAHLPRALKGDRKIDKHFATSQDLCSAPPRDLLYEWPTPARLSPVNWRAGIHYLTFDACSGFARVTARKVLPTLN